MTGLDDALARLALSLGPGAELDGDRVRLEQRPEDGLELRITILDDDGEPRSVASAFTPRDGPPASFPANLPFLPGAHINVIDDRERDVLLALWRIEEGALAGGGGAADPVAGAAFDRVVALSVEDGWTVEERAEGRARLSKGGRRRRVEGGPDGGGAAVSMAERPA